MLLDRIRVKNFKSIKQIDMTLTPLTMIVGANASGKSNLINVFRFISNIMTSGIDNAIALQGGITYLANASLPKGTPIEIYFSVDFTTEADEWVRKSDLKGFGFSIYKIEYQFKIQPNLRGNGYHLDLDSLTIMYNCLTQNIPAKKGENYTDLGQTFSYTFLRRSRASKIEYEPKLNNDCILDEKQINAIKTDTAARFFRNVSNEDKNELMLSRLSLLLPPIFTDESFIRIFDFDPRELKKASSMASVRYLNEDGSNLASVLQRILRKKDDKKKLTTLLNEFLPFVEGVTIENNLDKSFSYKIQERFANRAFHATFLSDGTVSVLAIIVALYFEDNANIIILEEPERNIHPKLLATLLSSAEDISTEKQIIITTHNPELLKHSNLESVRLINRNQQGFSNVSRPIDSSIVNSFIQNNLGLDDLFVQDLLGD